MYELTKQKSTGSRIIFGIIIFVFIAAVLNMAIPNRSSTLNDDLIKAANEINQHAPIIIDSTTRLDNVNALSGSTFQYNYTLLTVLRTEVDTNQLKSSAKEIMITQLKNNPKVAIFKENNIEIRLRYTDKKGAEVTTIYIYPTEY